MNTFTYNTPRYNFSLSHQCSDSYIQMKVGGLMEGDDFRKNTMKMLDLLLASKVNKLLVDARELNFISYSDSLWMENTFLPYATSCGFRAVSFIKPYRGHARNCIENIMFQVDEDKLAGAWFDRPEEAREWIGSFTL